MASEEIEKWELELTRRIVMGWAAGSSARKVRVEDFTQDALIHWWNKKIEKGFGAKPRGEQEALLRTVTKGFLRDEHKRMSAKTRSEYLQTAELTENAPAPREKRDSELREIIENSLQELTPRQREICELLGHGARGGKSEIARQLGISRSTLYKEERVIAKVFSRRGLGDRRLW